MGQVALLRLNYPGENGIVQFGKEMVVLICKYLYIDKSKSVHVSVYIYIHISTIYLIHLDISIWILCDVHIAYTYIYYIHTHAISFRCLSKGNGVQQLDGAR